MIITKAYLNTHKTEAGGYTRVQLNALGQKWGELKKGWQKGLIGTELSAESASRFESKQTAKEARGIKKATYAELAGSVKLLEARIIELELLLSQRG
tara:strand:+ start:1396 stop:1686 length:291 start_codon:yes stop_codon:yes gene_type:complete